jgi:perosamine synthetase
LYNLCAVGATARTPQPRICRLKITRNGAPMKKRIPLSEPVFAGNEWKYIQDCLDSRWVSSGKYVDLFEEKIALYLGAQFGVSTVNGTSAIHTALLVAGVQPGDCVVVPTLTFIATVNPVTYCGAIPVFIDAEEETLNLDPEKAVETIRDLVRQKTPPKAIIVTHLYGHPCDLDPILEVARKHGIVVIEDACESLGSKYKGKMTGALGDIGCLSFNGNKIITTGGGGMLLTDNALYARKARYLTTQARDHQTEYIHGDTGYNYRMSNLQAALGVAQLEQLEAFLQKKKMIADHYHEYLMGIPGTKLLCQQPWAESNFWLNTLLLKNNGSAIDKNSLMEKLRQHGIDTRPIFSAVHLQGRFATPQRRNLPIAESCLGINLPSSVDISKEELIRVTETIKTLLKSPFGELAFPATDAGIWSPEGRIPEPGAGSQKNLLEGSDTGILE